MSKIGFYVALLVISASCSRGIKVKDIANGDNYIVNNNNILLFLPEKDSLLEFKKVIYEGYCSTTHSISYSEVENKHVIGYCNAYRKSLTDSIIINDFFTDEVKFIQDTSLYNEEVSVYKKSNVMYLFFKRMNVLLVTENNKVFGGRNICKEVVM